MGKKKGRANGLTNAVRRSIEKMAAKEKSISTNQSSPPKSTRSKNIGNAASPLNGTQYRQMMTPKSLSSLGFKPIRFSGTKQKSGSDAKSKRTTGMARGSSLKARSVNPTVMSDFLSKKVSTPFHRTYSNAQNAYESRSVLPVSDYRVSSAFGVDRGTHRHSGIDLAIPEGTTVAAAQKGKVSFAGWGNGYGYRVVLDHGDGTQTTYNHLSDIGVKVGDMVDAGSAIALSGNTGRSTGPHLHFEVKKDGRYVDPTLYFDFEHGKAVKDNGKYTSQMASISSSGSAGASSGKTSSRRSSRSSSGRGSGSSAKKIVLPVVKYSAPTGTAYFNASIPKVSAFSINNRSVSPSFQQDMNPLLSLIPSYRVQKKTTKRQRKG